MNKKSIFSEIIKKEIHVELHKKNPSFSNPKFDKLRKEI